MKKQYIILGLVLLALSLTIHAEEDGGYAGAFLRLPISPRAAAMGSAYIGLSDDASGQLYNPAGITSIRQMDFTSSYRMMDFDRKLGFVSILFPTRLESSLGISWIYAGSGDVETRSSSGYLTGGTVSSADHAFSVSFAKQFLPFLGMGAKLNYYYKTFDDLSANSIGINVGAMLYVDSLSDYGSMEEKSINDIKIGIVLRNLAAQYSWEKETSGLQTNTDDAFPVEFGIGVSFHTMHRKLLVAVDGSKNDKQSFKFRTGAEYEVHEKADLRAGFNNGTLTAGAGFHLPVSTAYKLNIDYAFSLARVGEGSDHIFGLSFRF